MTHRPLAERAQAEIGGVGHLHYLGVDLYSEPLSKMDDKLNGLCKLYRSQKKTLNGAWADGEWIAWALFDSEGLVQECGLLYYADF